MTILGELMVYDSRDNDLLGYPRDSQYACPVCGVSANAHTPRMEAECTYKLWSAKPYSPPEKRLK